MKQAVPYFGRFLSKLVLEIIPGALVSVFAAYLLSMLHLGAEPATPSQTASAPQNDGLSADERRELTRQMLRERRENPEEPAEVKPVPSLRPASTSTADSGAVPHDHVAAPPATAESKLHAEPRPALATISPATPLPRTPAPRVKTEAAAAPVPPPPFAAPAAPTVTASLPPAAPAPAGAPTQLPQVSVNAPAVNAPVANAPAVNAPGTVPAGDLASQPQQRGIVGNIFSGVSTIAGGAANITGNTVNWVIDLPGKAISAGGKLLTGSNGSTPAAAPGGGPASANATAAGNAAPPANTAPAAPPAPLPMIDPQRRNFL
jgi:hypothetical protein